MWQKPCSIGEMGNRIMTMAIRFLKQYPLLFQLVAYVLGFSFLLAILLSVIQISVAHQSELDTIAQDLVKLQASQSDSLAQNLWNMDQEGIAIQLQSMAQYPDVLAVVLKDSQGGVFQAGSMPANQDNLIVKSAVLKKEFSDKSVELGSVTLYASPDHFEGHMMEHIQVRLITELLALLLTGSFIVGIFLLKFNRHINRIAKFADDLGVDTLDRELRLVRKASPNKQPDELDRIVFSLNEMRRRLNKRVLAQRQTEEHLQREIVFSDAIINSLPGIFVVYDEKLKAIIYNKMYREKLGVPSGDVSKYDFLDRVVPEDKEKFREAIRNVFASQEPASFEVELFSVDNIRVPYLVNGRVFEYEGQKFLIGMGADISKQKKIEEGVRQSQKLEAIGTLAGGIAHDFNNVLAAIMGNLQLAQSAFSEPEKLNNYLQSGFDASLRARDLVEQILSISRRGQKEKQPLQPAAVVEEVVKLLRASIPTTIDIKYDLGSPKYILGDATQIHQVILNLCTNAYHAMQESGGCLTITLSEKSITELEHLPSLDLPAGEYISLEVCDTGCGMDKLTRKRIFEPYFTTKKSGSGTGLGLAVVQGIVQGHDGHIAVSSDPGCGTSFRLFFPLLAGQDLIPAAEVETVVIPRGNERVLLVDDEQDILDALSGLIRLHGYSVTTFRDSREALTHFRRDPSQYDLVITDMTMPNLSGKYLGKKIMAIRPEIPVILCTGYSKVMGSTQSLQEGFAAYLAKPVEAETLLLTIRETLDAAAGRQLNILLADDDIFNQKIVRLLLELQGHQVVIADNGKVALQKLIEEDYDIIFMDMQMPVLGGLLATEVIRDCEKSGKESVQFERWTGQQTDKLQGRHIPVIALTGNLDEESRRMCREAGMDEFLAKPFTREAVNRILQKVIHCPVRPTVAIKGMDEASSGRETEENTEKDLFSSAMAHLQSVHPLEEQQLVLLIDESVRSLRQSMKGAEQALEEKNSAALASVAHKLKGTLMGLGLKDQVGDARDLQLLAEKEDLKEFASLIQQMSHSLKSLLEKDLT